MIAPYPFKFSLNKATFDALLARTTLPTHVQRTQSAQTENGARLSGMSDGLISHGQWKAVVLHPGAF